MHESSETRRAASAAGCSPADRDAPPGDPHEDRHGEDGADGHDESDGNDGRSTDNDLVSAVEDLVNDLVPTGDEPGRGHR